MSFSFTGGETPSFIPGEQGYQPPGAGIMTPKNATGIDINDWLSKLKTVNPLVNIGSTFLGGLFDMLGGKSWGEKKREELYGYLGNLRNKPLIRDNRIDQLQPMVEKSTIPYLNELAKSSHRVGTGSGAFIGEILREAEGRMAEKQLAMRWDAIKTNALAPLQISQEMARLL